MEALATIFMYLVFVGLLVYVAYGFGRMVKKSIGHKEKL